MQSAANQMVLFTSEKFYILIGQAAFSCQGRTNNFILHLLSASWHHPHLLKSKESKETYVNSNRWCKTITRKLSMNKT